MSFKSLCPLSLDFDLPSACRPWFEALHSFILACQKLGQRGPTADYEWVTVVAFVGFHCDIHGPPRNENPNVETYFHFPGLGRMTWAKASKTLANLAVSPIWPVLWVEKDLLYSNSRSQKVFPRRGCSWVTLIFGVAPAQTVAWRR